MDGEGAGGEAGEPEGGEDEDEGVEEGRGGRARETLFQCPPPSCLVLTAAIL